MGENMEIVYSADGAVPVAAMAAMRLSGRQDDLKAVVLKDMPKTAPPVLRRAEAAAAKVVTSGTKNILRYLAGCATHPALDQRLYGASALARVHVEEWLDTACRDIVTGAGLSAVCAQLNCFMAKRTYLVGHGITLADLVVFGQLCTAPQFASILKTGALPHLARWYALVNSCPAVSGVIAEYGLGFKRGQNAGSAVGGAAQSKKKGDVGGSFDINLKDAEMGKVVTRFPPEPSGYLHIGHAKAALMNEYFARAYEGKLLVRFDDTNPSKENEEFVENILNDIKSLGIEFDGEVTYTSDYFDQLLELGEEMIRKGHMFVDNTPVDQMREERLAKKESASRGNTVDENLRRWREMLVASEEGQACAARMKMDMSNANGCLRDPVCFRCNLDPHLRTGTKYKCYPTYDFACPYVDAIEGVTHALRSAEYADREPQFVWMQKIMGCRKVHIWEYSRLNFKYTVLSKRKLQWFVNQNIVDGWDDPRFPTVQGIMRRGLTLPALREFIKSQGASRNCNLMEWDKIWAVNKKHIDPVCPRHTAVTLEGRVMVTLENGPAAPELLAVPKHKKNPDVGSKALLRSKQIWIDQADALDVNEGEEVTLMDWGNAIFTSITRGGDGTITAISARLHLEGDFKKTRLKLTWLAVSDDLLKLQLVEFGHIISKPKPEEDDDISDIVNRDSRTDIMAEGDMNMRSLKAGDIIQIERKGYFRVDQPYIRDSKPAVLFKIPDGKQERTTDKRK